MKKSKLTLINLYNCMRAHPTLNSPKRLANSSSEDEGRRNGHPNALKLKELIND